MRPTRLADAGLYQYIHGSVYQPQLYIMGLATVQPDATQESSTQQRLLSSSSNSSDSYSTSSKLIPCIHTHLTGLPPLAVPCIFAYSSPLVSLPSTSTVGGVTGYGIYIHIASFFSFFFFFEIYSVCYRLGSHILECAYYSHIR